MIRKIPFPDCGVELTVGLMTVHRWCMHGKKPEIDRYWLLVIQTENILKVFDVSFPKGTSQHPFPFTG